LHHRLSLIVRRAALLGLLIVPASPAIGGAGAVAAAENPSFGSSTTLRNDALRSLPLSKLTQQGRSLSNRVLGDVTIFRRLPTQVIECDAEMFEFLVENPDLVINMWEVLGVTKVTMKRLGPTSYQLDDGHGTTGTIHYLYRSPTQHVVYCEGTYSGALIARPIRGRCVLSLRSVPVRDAEERDYVQCRLDSFVQLDNVGAEVIAKTFQTVLGGIADHNFRETTGFAAKVSEAAEESPENIHRIAARLTAVPDATKQRFTTIGDRIGAAALGLTEDGGPALAGPTGEKTASRPGDVKK
jgi:hypothetical protein